ncbi:MAG: M48 family metalloprotease [Fibrella sp.]|nr:M48 family metalloprotease [Armatimonadota bacterium]
MSPADASWRVLSLLWQASWQGTLFAVAVGLICLIRRIPAPYRAFLWFLAGVKFLVGFLYLLCFGRGVPLSVSVPTNMLPVSQAKVTVAESPVLAFSSWILAGWIIGVILCVLTVVIRARTTSRTLARAEPNTVPAVTQMLSVMSARIGVPARRMPSVRVAPKGTDGPQVTLSGRGCVVVLPAPLLPPSPTALSENDLRFVIAHELGHVRRGDLWAGLLFAAMQVLFFFHPCAVWVKREWEAAREEACDLLALRACADGDRDTAARYGALLLRLGSGSTLGSAGSAPIAASPFAALRRRLTHLNRYQTESHGGFSRTPLLIGLPILVALLIPLEPRWVTTSPGPRLRSVTARRTLPTKSVPVAAHVAKTSSVALRPISRKVAITVALPRVKVIADRYTVAVAKRVPAAVSTPAPSRVFVVPAPKSIASGEPKPTPLVPSEPLLITPPPTVEPVAASISPSPVSVTPEASPDLSGSPLLSIVIEDTDSSSGTAPLSRSVDTVAARASGSGSDNKVAPRTGITAPALDNARPSVTRPIPLPSPSPAPASLENAARDADISRPSSR